MKTDIRGKWERKPSEDREGECERLRDGEKEEECKAGEI